MLNPNLSLLIKQNDPTTDEAYAYSHIHDHQAYNKSSNRTKGRYHPEESSSDVSESDQYDISKYLPRDIYKKLMNPSIKSKSKQKNIDNSTQEKESSEIVID
jgi:hypothetical protein